MGVWKPEAEVMRAAEANAQNDAAQKKRSGRRDLLDKAELARLRQRSNHGRRWLMLLAAILVLALTVIAIMAM